ncbi:MAG: radical SAM family heme chaperone HemW [Gemmobacter sp.]
MKHAEPRTGRAFGLYVHWPFCESKCPYCDFNSHVAAGIDHDRWLRAYLSEIERLGRELPALRLQTIFFGGGTPSLMSPETVHAVVDSARHAWPGSNDLEVTLEANPGSSDRDRFRAFAQAGVNRISIGVQSLRDDALVQLGRRHTVRDARRAIEAGLETFGRVSIDLIYARQHQTASEWRAELAEGLATGVSHLSLYQLTIEDGTVFQRRRAAGHLTGLPSDELAAALYEMTQEACAAAGRPAYEVSNHATPGEECRHNLLYWSSADYAGIGPGAHGRLTLSGERVATECIREPIPWLRRVEAAGSGEHPRIVLPAAEQFMEFLLMGMRLSHGIDLVEAARLDPDGLDQDATSEMIDDDLVVLHDGRLSATPRGRLLLNTLIARMLAR